MLRTSSLSVKYTFKELLFWHCTLLYHYISFPKFLIFLSWRHLVFHVTLAKHMQLNKTEIEIGEKLFADGTVQYSKHKVKKGN